MEEQLLEMEFWSVVICGGVGWFRHRWKQAKRIDGERWLELVGLAEGSW